MCPVHVKGLPGISFFPDVCMRDVVTRQRDHARQQRFPGASTPYKIYIRRRSKRGGGRGAIRTGGYIFHFYRGRTSRLKNDKPSDFHRSAQDSQTPTGN